MKLQYVPLYLLECADALFYQYLKDLEVDKENIPFDRLQHIGHELIFVLYERNKRDVQPLSDLTLSFITQRLCERLGVLQDY